MFFSPALFLRENNGHFFSSSIQFIITIKLYCRVFEPHHAHTHTHTPNFHLDFDQDKVHHFCNCVKMLLNIIEESERDRANARFLFR